MSTAASQPVDLVNELGFAAVEPHKAIGQLRDIPTTMTVLSGDPLTLMFGFRLHPDGTNTQPIVAVVEGSAECRATVSFENGFAWLTLYDLAGVATGTLRSLVQQVAETIASSDLAVGPGCLHCGTVEGAKFMYLEGRPTRLCSACLAQAAREQQEREALLNRPSLGATMGLPGVGTFVACGWAVIWTLIDLILQHWRIQVVEINEFTAAAMLLLFGGAGLCLGWPMGVAVRQSFAIRRAPMTMSVVVAVAAAVGGEVLFLALRLLRLAGIFNLKLAAGLLGHVLSNYTAFWIVLKLGFLGAICLFAAVSSSERKTATLEV